MERHIDDLGVGQAIAGFTTSADVEAAARAGLSCIALLTGGFATSELRDAGAAAVYTDPAELTERLAETQLG